MSPAARGCRPSGLGTTSLSTDSLGLLDEPVTMTSETSDFGILATPRTRRPATTSSPSSRPVAGSYDIHGRYGRRVGTVSGTDTFTLDGLGGIDVLVGPDVASIWRITGVNAGTLELVGGAKIAFSDVESLTGAATGRRRVPVRRAGRPHRCGGRRSGSAHRHGRRVRARRGRLRLRARAAYSATVSGGSGTVAANLLKLGGTSGTGFVGVEVLGASVGISGPLSGFRLAIITARRPGLARLHGDDDHADDRRCRLAWT